MPTKKADNSKCAFITCGRKTEIASLNLIGVVILFKHYFFSQIIIYKTNLQTSTRKA